MASLLRVLQVSKAFGGLQAVKDLSLDVEAGTILGIMGPNGAGKSTLFNIISGQTSPDSGAVMFEGRSVANRRPEVVAGLGLAKTFQTSRPFGTMTFIENVMVGALSRGLGLSAARTEAMAQLETVGLSSEANTLAAWASTGQRKRLDIARVLATGPRLLLLDEPFGGVDSPSVDSLIDILQGLRDAGVTLLVIEHNLDALHRLADSLIAMHLGQKIAEGSAEEVTNDSGVIQAYLGSSGIVHA